MLKQFMAIISAGLACSAVANSTVTISEPVTEFVFASCNRQHNPQPLWKKILAEPKQFFMWGGDNVYVNSSNPEVMKNEYQVLLNNPEYQALQAQTPIIGTWDDHDYGADNSGGEFAMKEFSRDLFFNFIAEPAATVRRQRSGVYTAYTMGPSDQQIKVILLDTRYNRTSSSDPNDNILGEEQWQWLERELATSKARAHFLVSSFSVLSPSLLGGEQWISWKKSYARLAQLIAAYQPSGLVILTGDRHFAGMLSKQLPNGVTYYELMASGLTHVAKPILRPILRNIYGDENAVFELNYGKIVLDWDHGPLEMRFQVHTDTSLQPALERRFSLDPNGIWTLN